MNESQDAAAERTNQCDDGFARQLAAVGWAKLAEFIGELRREVAETGDPIKRAHLKELEAATNMTPARRVMGGVTMLPDLRYPSSDIWEEAQSLIKIALAKTGYKGDSVDVWKRILDHYQWHRKKRFLRASIAHANWFAGWLLGQGRNDDSLVFRQLAIELTGLKDKERARRRAHNNGDQTGSASSTTNGPRSLRREIMTGSVLTPAKSRVRTGRRAPQIDPLAAVRTQIREMKRGQCSQLEICRRLGELPRPLNAAWKTLSWEAAYLDPKHRPAVKSWISRTK